MTKALTLIIVDDHPVFRSGLCHIIGAKPEYRLVGEAANGEAALALIEEKQPDIALLDIEMPLKNGLEVAKEVLKKELPTRLVVLTMYADEQIFNEAMDLGVAGYVLKENAVSDVMNCLKAVAQGQYYISPTISGYLVERSKRRQTVLAALPALETLTPAEWRILRFVAGNKTSKEIASDLSISYKTVENHRANIAEKLQLHGNNALLRFALEKKALLQ